MKWNLITDIHNLALEENAPYLVCVENWNGHSSEWHPMVAHWYLEGSDVTLREPDNTPHKHDIKKTGFYVIHDCGQDRFKHIYRIKDVRYYAEITYPNKTPDDFLTIE